MIPKVMTSMVSSSRLDFFSDLGIISFINTDVSVRCMNVMHRWLLKIADYWPHHLI